MMATAPRISEFLPQRYDTASGHQLDSPPAHATAGGDLYHYPALDTAGLGKMRTRHRPDELSLTTGARWPTPKSRDFAALNDPGLYAEVLAVASADGDVSVARLMSEEGGLRQRLRRLWLVEKSTKTSIRGVLSALQRFGWLAAPDSARGQYILTAEGRDVATTTLKDATVFRRVLARKMHEIYVIPGWLVARLLALNPEGQGEVVLPSPPRDWRPEARPWEESRWTGDLADQAKGSADNARRSFPGSFPISNKNWLDAVRQAWQRLSSRTRRQVSRTGQRHGHEEERRRIATFSPRGRLAGAMREAAVGLLFGLLSPRRNACDFLSCDHPIPPRSFRAWCPRLDDLELVFYTDCHPRIAGRLLFPCAAFHQSSPGSGFERIEGIFDPQGAGLWLHQPTWSAVGPQFLRVLADTYGHVSQEVGSAYVSLLDVRDEVCRQLRLSSRLFDELLETACQETFRERLADHGALSISLETDIRPEQRSGHGLLRRPVYIEGVPHSLIAVATTRAPGTDVEAYHGESPAPQGGAAVRDAKSV